MAGIGKIENLSKIGNPNRGPNKFTKTMKEAISLAFDKIGGVEALAEWARDNRTDFYKIAARLIPVEVQARVTHRDETQLTDDELESIARGSRAGVTYTAEGEEVTH